MISLGGLAPHQVKDLGAKWEWLKSGPMGEHGQNFLCNNCFLIGCLDVARDRLATMRTLSWNVQNLCSTEGVGSEGFYHLGINVRN